MNNASHYSEYATHIPLFTNNVQHYSHLALNMN